MAELTCSVSNCTYNQDHLCGKGDIMVGGKHADNSDGTRCESFMERRGDSFANMADAGKVIHIDCEAVKCVYNSNYKCVADHVDIAGCGADNCRETSCATFMER